MYGIKQYTGKNSPPPQKTKHQDASTKLCMKWCSWCKNESTFVQVEDKVFERTKYKCKTCYEFGRNCLWCANAMTREYGVNGECDKRCLLCAKVITSWITAKQETIETYEGWCSWCFNRTDHELVQHNQIRRNVYKCMECSQRTLKCTDCLYLVAKLGYKPKTASGEVHTESKTDIFTTKPDLIRSATPISGSRTSMTAGVDKGVDVNESIIERKGVATTEEEGKMQVEQTGEKVQTPTVNFAFARGNENGDDKWCALHQGRITEWGVSENKDRLCEYRFCSWCVSQEKHVLATGRFIGRNAYNCQGCGMHTLICYWCTDGMAMGGTFWDDRTCVVCQSDYVGALQKGLQPLNESVPVDMSNTIKSFGIIPAYGQHADKTSPTLKEVEAHIENVPVSTSVGQGTKARGIDDYVGDVESFLSVWNSRVNRKAKSFQGDSLIGVFASTVASATDSVNLITNKANRTSAVDVLASTEHAAKSNTNTAASTNACKANSVSDVEAELDMRTIPKLNMAGVADKAKITIEREVPTTGVYNNQDGWNLLVKLKERVYNSPNTKEDIEIRLKEDTEERKDALELGFIRPYLFILSMSHEQRNRVANILGWSLVGTTIFGEPAKETWMILSNKHGFFGYAQDASERWRDQEKPTNLDWCHIIETLCAKSFPSEIIPKVPRVEFTKELSKISNPNTNWDIELEDTFLRLLAEWSHAQMSEDERALMKAEIASKEGQQIIENISDNAHISNKDVLSYGVHVLYGLNNITKAQSTSSTLDKIGKGAALFGAGALATTLGIVGIGLVAFKAGEAAYQSAYHRLFGPVILITQHRLMLASMGVDVKEFY
eukprot:CFRG2845T1